MTGVGGFVHLHVHTHHSMMRSTVRVDALVAAAAAQGARGLAVTDEWSLAAVPRFTTLAEAAGIQPVIGMEIRLRPRDPVRRRRRSYALVLLAHDPRGFRNLCSLVGLARRGRWEPTPAVDWDQLRDHSEGLLALSANVHGEIGALLAAQRHEAAARAARALAELFGRDNLHLEIQVTGEYNQAEVNAGQRDIAERLGLGLVATNPVHYLHPGDALAHQVLLCIGQDRRLVDLDSPSMPSHGFYLRDPVELYPSLAADAALHATVSLAERCRLRAPGVVFVPPRPCWQRVDREAQLERIAREGMLARIGALRKHVPLSRFEDVGADLSAALRWELEALVEPPEGERLLLAHRVVHACREAGVPVGPGVGPGASAAVLYALGVTGVDPVEFDLLSERHLDPAREPRPILLDIHPSQIDHVVACVADALDDGCRVVRPARPSLLDGRALVDAAMAALDLRPDEVGLRLDALTASWKAGTGRDHPSGRPIARVRDQLEELAEILDRFAALDGCPSGTEAHGAAFAVVDHPIEPPIPARRADSGADLVQYDLESMVRAHHAVFELVGEDDVPLAARVDAILAKRGVTSPGWADCAHELRSDTALQQLLGCGNTLGIPSLEDRPCRRALTGIGPTDIEELMAAIVLGRHGPAAAGLLDAYTSLEGVLGELGSSAGIAAEHVEPTRGVLLYQEQVMRILSSLGGLDHGETWPLVRALGRGRAGEIEDAAERFIERATSQDHDLDTLLRMWQWLGRWTRYTLCRASVASMAIKASKLAWLKAHHPAEFFAVLLSSAAGDRRRVRRIVEDMRMMGVELLGADVLLGDVECTVTGGRVRLGLTLVRGMDVTLASAIVAARGEQGKDLDLLTWLSLLDPQHLRRRPLLSLVAAGALDTFGHARASVTAGMDDLIRAAAAVCRDRDLGQELLFGEVEARLAEVLPEVEEWSPEVKHIREVEAVGSSLARSSHVQQAR